MRLTLTFLSLFIASSVLVTGIEAQQQRRPSPAELPTRNKAQNDQKLARRGGADSARAKLNPRSVFLRFDKNQDNRLTIDEVPVRLQFRFSTFDTDGNGKLTLRELSTEMKKQRQRIQQRGEETTAQFKNGRGSKGEIPSAADMLALFDRNFDDVLTDAEIPERLKKKFSDIDKNGDMQLDEKELVAAVERLKAAKQSKGNRFNTDSEKSKGVIPKRPPRNG